MQISLTGIEVIDLFFRFAAAGQLGLLSLWLIAQSKSIPAPKLAMVYSIIGYILLTAPIENEHYGGLRNVLLLLTDIMPLAALWYTASQLTPEFKLKNVSKWLMVPIVVWCLVLVYVFLVMAGKSILHDLNHAFGIMVLGYVIYLCLAEYFDDLDNQRRNTRLLVFAFCSFYMTGLAMFEFVLKDVRDSWQFSLINSALIFIIVSAIGVRVLRGQQHSDGSASSQHQKSESEAAVALSNTMEQGFYKQQELTIGKLAEELNMPAHKLRLLINKELGFSNFSHYLNSYRIPWVCQQLRDTEQKQTPILTLALEVGYGSIAPFNRAFKNQMGVTPKQYRDQF